MRKPPETTKATMATMTASRSGDNAGATGPIGIYSTSAQWRDITGLTAQSTPTAFNGQLADWVAGTDATLTQARQNCTSGGFTGVAPNLAQYRIGPLDADLRCTGTR